MFFSPPPEVTADVFAEVPEDLRPSESSDWARIQHPGKRFRAFLEGPSFDREGNCQRRCKTRPRGGVKSGQVTMAGAMARALTIELARAMAHWPLGAKSRRSNLRTFVAAFGRCCWRGDNSRRSFRVC